MKKIPMVGRTFGELKVVSDAGQVKGHQTWECVCSCGNHTIVYGENLRSGHTKTCGHCERYEEIDNQTMRCILPKGKTFLFDKDDLIFIKSHKWSIEESGYVHTTVNGKHIRLHRELLGNPLNKQIDHINGDRSDNRRSNLRIVSNQQNQWNRKNNPNNKTGYKGVFYDKRRLKYCARIMKDGKNKFLGYFNNPIDAAAAYDRAAFKLFGEFAWRNFRMEVVNGEKEVLGVETPKQHGRRDAGKHTGHKRNDSGIDVA